MVFGRDGEPHLCNWFAVLPESGIRNTAGGESAGTAIPLGEAVPGCHESPDLSLGGFSLALQARRPLGQAEP
ncbi:MAG: hypothetical protein AAF546_05510 [Verrucomicrobiota bacterium]